MDLQKSFFLSPLFGFLKGDSWYLFAAFCDTYDGILMGTRCASYVVFVLDCFALNWVRSFAQWN